MAQVRRSAGSFLAGVTVMAAAGLRGGRRAAKAAAASGEDGGGECGGGEVGGGEVGGGECGCGE